MATVYGPELPPAMADEQRKGKYTQLLMLAAAGLVVWWLMKGRK